MATHGGELDAPLLKIAANDFFTIRDALQGVAVFGGIGSGKTSGSGKALALAKLRAGMGGLVLCAKPEEAAQWHSYCAMVGRLNSLIPFDGVTWRFNFLAYELARLGGGGINAVIECLMRIMEIGRMASASPGSVGEAFWQDTPRQIFRNSIPVIHAAFGTVTIDMILRFLRSAPRSLEEMRDPEWQRTSFFYECFVKAAGRLDDATAEQAVAYWRQDFAQLDAKTRGNIVISLTTTLDRFNHGWLKTAFCTDTNVVPDLCFNGAVIVLDMPALTHNEDGVIAQQLFKYIWQRAMLARNALPVPFQQRPVFLYADEAQYFVNSYDAEFLSTCRGSRVAVTFLSQSLPTYYAKIGGDNARDRAHHLLGNFATRIWHNNACAETNEWAAKTIGRGMQTRATYSQGQGTNTSRGMNMGEGSNWGSNSGSGGSFSHSKGGSSSGTSWNSGSSSGGSDNWGRNSGYGSNSSVSQGWSEQLDYLIEPGDFSRMLRTGGPANGNRVSAVWYQAGRCFNRSSDNMIIAEFAQ
jgi:hypothetical protein